MKDIGRIEYVCENHKNCDQIIPSSQRLGVVLELIDVFIDNLMLLEEPINILKTVFWDFTINNKGLRISIQDQEREKIKDFAGSTIVNKWLASFGKQLFEKFNNCTIVKCDDIDCYSSLKLGNRLNFNNAELSVIMDKVHALGFNVTFVDCVRTIIRIGAKESNQDSAIEFGQENTALQAMLDSRYDIFILEEQDQTRNYVKTQKNVEENQNETFAKIQAENVENVKNIETEEDVEVRAIVEKASICANTNSENDTNSVNNTNNETIKIVKSDSQEGKLEEVQQIDSILKCR